MPLRSAGNDVKGRALGEEKAKKTSSSLPLPVQFLAAWVGVWCARALQQLNRPEFPGGTNS